MENKSLIWEYDGYSLYLNFFILEGEIGRSIISDLLVGNQIDLSTYAYNAGYGADLLATTAGCFNDPFNLVSIICPVSIAEYCYEALIFIRFYLAACCFSLFCFEKGKKGWPVLIASLIYVTSGFVVFWGVTWHANFLNVAILLPMILLGAERIFNGKRSFTLIAAVTLSLVFSVYFSYMLLIALFCYCLIKFLCSENRSVRKFFSVFIKFLVPIFVSFCMAGIVLIPELLVLTSMGRVGLERAVSSFFSASYYISVPITLIGYPLSARAMCIGGLPVLVILVFLANFKKLNRLEAVPWLIGLVLCFFGLLIPFVGKAFNGFSYVSDRWMVIWAFCVAYIVCLAIPLLKKNDIFDNNLQNCLILCFFGVLLTTAFIESSLGGWCAVALFAFTVIFVMVLNRCRVSTKLFSMFLILVVIGSSCIISIYRFSSEFSNNAASYGTHGEVSEVFEENPAKQLEGLVSDDCRVSQPRAYTFRNAMLNAGVLGTDFYSSFYNQNVDNFRQELGMSDDNSNYKFVGSNSRTAIDALIGAKYYLASNKDEYAVPQMYKKIDSLSNGYDLYVTDKNLPLSFIYKETISPDIYYDLDSVQKQEALLQGVVVENGSSSLSFSLNSEQKNVKVVGSENANIEENTISAKKKGAVISLEGTEVSEKDEIYLVINDFAFTPKKNWGKAQMENAKNISKLFQMKKENFLWGAATTANVTITCGDKSQTIMLRTSESSMYAGKNNWVINIGRFSSEETGDIKLTFSAKGDYSFSEMQIVTQQLDPIYKEIEKLKNNGNVEYSLQPNRITANVTYADEGDYVFFSIPYSSGWKASIDNASINIEKANSAFMAIKIPSDGEHEIILTYETPGLRIGMFATLIGILGFIVLNYIERSRSKKSTRNKIL